MIVLTGSEGFIAKHVRDKLEARGCGVFGLDRMARNTYHLEDYVPPLDDAHAIIHCAAHADISRNWESRTEREALYRDNITALINVLERARYVDVPFVFVSSAAVTHDPSGSPYAATKAMGEILCRTYLGMRARIVRLVSCVGAGYSHGHVADFVKQARARGSVHALDDGRAPKSFVHVEDAAGAIVYAAIDDWTPRIDNTMHVAAEPWGWRDTCKVMGVPFTFKDQKAGWEGDPVGLYVKSDWKCKRHVYDGVRDALKSLGWGFE